MIVALGDSITDGTFLAPDAPSAPRPWPDHLARRLADRRPGTEVVNAGLGGNRITGGTEANPSILDRLDRDALAYRDASTVLLCAGINDIAWGGAQAAEVIAAMTEVAARARARGLRIICATVTPFGGWTGWSATKEAVRRRVNAFVRDSRGVFDGYVDFDAAVRDPAAPDRYAPRYDCGDHLHPNDAGMRALAAAVDLDALC